MARPTKKNPLGKQTKPKQEDEKVLQKLEESWSLGLNEGETCCYAGIAFNTYKSILSGKPELLKRKEVLSNNLQMRSKLILSKYMSGGNKIKLGDKEVDISDNMIKANQRRLERKSRDEFATKVEQKHDGETTQKIIIEKA